MRTGGKSRGKQNLMERRQRREINEGFRKTFTPNPKRKKNKKQKMKKEEPASKKK